ncbi:hypothetical protein [Photobacterium chitinilyticum]|uniref:Uncharacterized protein n=1 Tax=Photobacterium chitinilyticum TaxID=2485123 RepID=A0A3S3RXL7_9GAMM|nr:hypothetical protein [Photobacterium chitinilyticum]RWX52760.1 hypothetical protein EDI28_25565 [Photobacterium chitinilyticum]
MYVVSQEKVYYSNKEPIPLDEVIASLQGLSELFKMVPTVLEYLDNNLIVEEIEVFVDEVSKGSLWEVLAVGLAFGTQQSFDEHLKNSNDWAHAKLMNAGITDKNIRNGLIVVVALLAVGGASLAFDSMKKLLGGREDSAATIQANNNIFINIGAEAYGTSPDAMQEAIASAIRQHGKKKVAKEARKVVAPAKREEEAEIKFFSGAHASDLPVLTFDKKLVEALPSYDFEDGDVNLPQPNVEIYITSMDIERHKSGWAAHIPSISENKRIPISFNSDANLEQIAEDRNYLADLTIVYTRDKASGDLKPKRAFISKLGAKLDHGYRGKNQKI